MHMIEVDYRMVDNDLHFFTTENEIGRGLCVMHSDWNIAHNEVYNQLKVLLEHNHGITDDWDYTITTTL